MLYVHLLMLENQISAAGRTERESISENSYVNPLFPNSIGFSLTLLYTFPLVLTWEFFKQSMLLRLATISYILMILLNDLAVFL